MVGEEPYKNLFSFVLIPFHCYVQSLFVFRLSCCQLSIIFFGYLHFCICAFSIFLLICICVLLLSVWWCHCSEGLWSKSNNGRSLTHHWAIGKHILHIFLFAMTLSICIWNCEFVFFICNHICLVRERCEKKPKKKLTNVSLYVCMSAENRKMFFFPTVVIYRLFQWSLRKKT